MQSIRDVIVHSHHNFHFSRRRKRLTTNAGTRRVEQITLGSAALPLDDFCGSTHVVKIVNAVGSTGVSLALLYLAPGTL